MYSSLDTRPENRTPLGDTTRFSQMSEYLLGIAQPAKHFKRLGACMNFLWFHAWRLNSKPYASDPFCTTILGYCSRTKVKSCLILRRFYATWLLSLTLGLKCYYLWELYPPWVLVNALVLSTNVARSTMSLVWIKKKKLKLKLKPFKYTSHTKVVTFV